MIQLIKGFKDILPEEIELWQKIESTAQATFKNFGFSEIRIPILERAELFQRGIGEDTDIVSKEMYTFPDRKGALITLRPEATASVVRSYIQHKMYATDPVRKLYTIGPMFRRERPQKGRYRQFYQINAEVFGVESPFIDAQIIFMLSKLFTNLSITQTKVHLNSLGCPQCRPKHKKALSNYLASVADALCSDCKQRSTRNPLRVLDCKVPTCKSQLTDAPVITDYICSDCETHFDCVQNTLEKQNIAYKKDHQLVRGLDYYSRTAFEIQTDLLGAQGAIAGGGRYDNLVKMLGGPSTPAIGFAIGFDRLVELVRSTTPQEQKKLDLFIAALGENSKKAAYEWACTFSLNGITTEMDFSGRSLKSLMKRANRLNANNVLIIGDHELEQGSVIFRNMQTQTQDTISIDTLIETLKAKIERSHS